jgi:hypothetical protein
LHIPIEELQLLIAEKLVDGKFTINEKLPPYELNKFAMGFIVI